VTARFSEPVTGVAGGRFVLRAGAAVAATVSYDPATRTARLNPAAALLADTRYTATLSGVTDLAGNAMTPVSWTFTTGAAPAVTRVTPADGATGARRGRNVTVTFGEPVLGVSTRTVTLTRVSGGVTVTARVTYDAATRTATLDPPATLAAGTRYRLRVTGGPAGVRDRAGNPFVSRAWTFTTGQAG
jgi:hypothetical protein